MPIKIKDLKKFKQRVDDYPGIEIFYLREDRRFRIQAGKAAMIVEMAAEKEADQFQDWLDRHEAIETEGWIDTAELFG